MKQFRENIYKEDLSVILIKSLSCNRYLFFKRYIDVVVVIVLLPVALPSLFIGMLLIKLFSNGPIFFKQERVGLNNKPFFIYKLRTMVHQLDHIDLNYTVAGDERIFTTGKLLRITKIDEIPQFYNILRGEMSLIGPRPERVDIVKSLSSDIQSYNLRHLIKPGISGLAQINNPKATPNESVEKLEYDLFYIYNLDFRLDLKILWKTFFIVLKLDSL